MSLRVSFIDFLNSVPLGWGFLEGPYAGDVELLFDVPSECARHLREGQADVGLVPTIEYQRIPGLKVLPGIAIASKHEVRSVLFISKKPWEEVDRVALDASSRTSVVLLKLLMGRFLGRKGVEYVTHRPDPETMLRSCDAALLIGNPALRVQRSRYHVYDLAAEWNRFTGLPFVFAFWAVRPGVELGPRARLFYQSREYGLKHIDQICSRYSSRLSLPAPAIRDYLTRHLSYGLDEEDLRGLDLFFRLASEENLIPEAKPVVFVPVGEDRCFEAARG